MLKGLLAAVAAASLFSLGACGQSTEAETHSTEGAAQDVQNAADEAAQSIERAGDEAAQNIEQAGDHAADAVHDATDGNPHTNP